MNLAEYFINMIYKTVKYEFIRRGYEQEQSEHYTRIIVIALFFLTVVFAGIFALVLPDQPKQKDRIPIQDRIESIQTALLDLDTLSSEVEALGQEALEAERRANEAITLLNLSQEELEALDQRIQPRDNKRDIIFLVIGAILGVVFDRISRVIEKVLSRKDDVIVDTKS